MAKVKITGHASGTGVVTITAPNTSTDRTITLPDGTGTLLDENSSLPAANLTGTVADARISALTASKLTGDLPAISGVNVTSVRAVNSGRKNWIINGGFDVSQRGTYTTATSAPDGYYLDRWAIDVNAITANIQQLTTTVDGGTVKTMKIIATSSATGALQMYQVVEAFAALAGRTLTFSARVKSNQSSTRLQIYDGVSFIDDAGSRHTGGGDWENLSLTFTPSSSSTTLNTRITGYDGLIALTTGDYIEAANVQLELGSVATDFEHRSYGEELALCQRYFERRSYTGSAVVTIGTAYSATHCMAGMNFMEKRAIPSITMPACSAAGFSFLTAIANYPSNHGTMTVTGSTISKNNFRFASVNGAGHTAGDATWVHSGGTNHIDIDAEL